MQSWFNFPETADIETSSDAYARRFAGKTGAWFLQVQETATLRLLAAYPGATLLDVGGGHGQLTPALVRHGYQVTVLGSAEMCQRRIQHWVETRLCTFRVGNILALPYADQAFDVVVSYRLLPHVTRWQQLVGELSRVASKVVVVDYPTICSVNYIAPLLFPLKKRVEGNTRPYTSFKAKELLQVFQASSFRYTAHYPEFFLPMVLHRFMRLPRLSSAIEMGCRLAGLTQMFGSPVILRLIRDNG
jgi:ubiquinone/menaquinone biosynthesis C-methylase UbiE